MSIYSWSCHTGVSLVYAYLPVALFYQLTAPLQRAKTLSNKAKCWVCLAISNAWSQDPSDWAVLHLATEVVNWLETLNLGSYWAVWAFNKTWFYKSAGYVNSLQLYDYLNCISQITPVANKYPTLFYLKGVRWWWLKVYCAEIAILETI